MHYHLHVQLFQYYDLVHLAKVLHDGFEVNKTTNLFISCRYILSVKYLVSGLVLLMHCKLEFMKQVLPRLLSPVAPSGTCASTVYGIIE